MDVGAWLREIGLGQFEALFHEHEVEADILPDLTEVDLEKMGLPLGPRQRLLKAIARLGSTEIAAKLPFPAPARGSMDAAERRQLTVMFCDLVGSTAMSARLDPEDMREVIRAYQDACSGAIARYDGFVAKFMGDGVIAYFGFPRAHEDDAERAARAGLDIVAVVGKLETRARQTLKVRIGIATGIVVVGDLVGEGAAQEQAVVGDTPNLAARLQGLAEPGGVVIAAATRQLLGGTFELKPLGPQTLKGFDSPILAWTIEREVENLSRFEASRTLGMTPFVGREHEVAVLLDRWRDASEGDGQVALLSGEAGIGKSRIVAALHERIRDERHILMRYQCSPHHINEAFYPIASQIWQASGFVSGEPPGARLDKLEAMIARAGLEPDAHAPWLAAMLSIPFEGCYPPIEMDPAEQKEQTIAVLGALFSALTKTEPVLAILEDAPWIDPTSLDVFGRLVEGIPDLRALFVVTSRPEFVAPWLGGAHVASLRLNRFAKRQAMALIHRVMGGKALPKEVLEQIIAKTDGVPLFVEELTKTVLESGLLREENGGWALAAALTPLAIPSTLQDSLMARLDRLAPVKEIAQIGAAIGREFSYRMLEAVAPIKGPALQDALGQLMAAELIHGRGAPPESSYLFKRALVQDTAHASLLRSRRQRIHADIARALEEHFADEVETAPAVMARHFTEAGLHELATRYWTKAAIWELSRSAFAEADRYAELGFGSLSHMPVGPSRQNLELSLHVARLSTLKVLAGGAAPRTVAAAAAARRLIDSGVGTELQRFTVLGSLYSANLFAAQLGAASALARQMVEIADRQDDTTSRLIAYRCLGVSDLYRGQNSDALRHLRRAEQFRVPRRDRLLSQFLGSDPGLVTLCFKLEANVFLGKVETAKQEMRQIQAELSECTHTPTIVICRYHCMVWADFVFGDGKHFERDTLEFVKYCGAKKVDSWRLIGELLHAAARARRNPKDEAVLKLRGAIAAYRDANGGLSTSAYSGWLAEALIAKGDLEGAEAVLREVFDFVENSDERWWLAELHRLDSRIALDRKQPDHARAQASVNRAIDIARPQEARLLELRAATDLARLGRDTGAPDDPRALLAPILAAIEGGEDMKDVRAARFLLAEIG